MISELKAMGVAHFATPPSNATHSKFFELNALIPPLPPRGNLDIHDVVKSKYFFA
jgi:DNA-directed RNA polymerase